MSIPEDFYPSEDDLAYEEELLRNPFSLKLWWRYLVARRGGPLKKRFVIYERALKALPGSYKLWHAYLTERLDVVRYLPITHSQYDALNNTFERALVTMHKMPRIWIMYLQSLTSQKSITRTRRTADRALCALPVTQHDRIWPDLYLKFASQRGIPTETSLRVYRRYLKYDPGHVEDFIEFLVNSGLWQEASERLASVLNDDEQFYSLKGKTKHDLWLELCDLLTRHTNEVSGRRIDVDAIIRGGIRKYTNEVGRLWTCLADYYIRRGLFDKARDIFEQGMATVITVRDFSVIFNAYAEFEQGMADHKIENMADEEDEEKADGGGFRLDVSSKFDKKKLLSGFWLNDNKDVDLMLARFDYLMERRPELANSVLLRQNPHNVEQWHRRVKLFDDEHKQISTYAEAVRTVDPMKTAGKPHTLWVAFAKLYEKHNDIVNASVIFEKAVQVNFKNVDDLACIWCEWAEMEIRHKNFKHALELLTRATAEPSVEVKRRVAAAHGNEEPVQVKLHKSSRLWALYVDLEESLGTLDSTRAVYERILDLRIATPQIIINYARLLEENKCFEDAFKVYERGLKIFKHPHVKDIWVTYLSKFVNRYGNTKLERSRELFDHAIEMTPADSVKPLYLHYAKLEEDHGLTKRAMEVYDQATKAVPSNEKLGMYEIYIARAAEIFGVQKTREIYEKAIESGLPEDDSKTMCTKYAELENNLGEIDRARAIYRFASQFLADPRADQDFWSKWHDLEVVHGNEDTFREMLRVKRTVTAGFSQMLKDRTTSADDAKTKLKRNEEKLGALDRMKRLRKCC
ncbi:Pre-mRNA-splicing factor SYF1 [Linum perenne]